MAYGMLIDKFKCIFCHGCSMACKATNGTPQGVLRSRVIRTTEGTYPSVKSEFTPMLCMQCAVPICVEVCPTEASYTADNGLVLINKEECIGCQSCVLACAYGARYLTDLSTGYNGGNFNEYEEAAYGNMIDGTVDKCDFCYSRTKEGEIPQPACIAACKVEARIFGDLDEISSLAKSENATQMLPENEPSVYYVNSR